MKEKREFMRHALATIAYRATRALEGAPDHFAGFYGVGRQPVEILAHMGDLFDWTLSMAKGSPRWRNSKPLPWSAEKKRFFDALQAFDAFLASEEQIHAPIERLLQGPIADALTHVGQLAMQRRLAGIPTRGENFYEADIEMGRLDMAQHAPVQPFKVG